MQKNSELIPAEGILTATPRTFTYDGHSFEVKGDRIIRDGCETCVLISAGYGGGWSTWDDKLTPFEPAAVIAVLAGRKDLLLNPEKGPFGAEMPSDAFLQVLGVTREDYVFMGGVRDLHVEYLPVGTLFQIEEYDGYESVRTVADMGYRA